MMKQNFKKVDIRCKQRSAANNQTTFRDFYGLIFQTKYVIFFQKDERQKGHQIVSQVVQRNVVEQADMQKQIIIQGKKWVQSVRTNDD